MRPVNKGTSPYTPILEYRDALPYLESRIRSKGFFSVWLEVIKDEPEIKKMLFDIFPGTETRFFDADGNVRPILHVEELEAATEAAT